MWLPLLLFSSCFNQLTLKLARMRPMGGCVAFPKYTGPGTGEAFCRLLIEESGVLLLPSSIYSSELTDVPQDHFRIGIGRDQVFKDGLAAMRTHFETHYSD